MRSCVPNVKPRLTARWSVRSCTMKSTNQNAKASTPGDSVTVLVLDAMKLIRNTFSRYASAASMQDTAASFSKAAIAFRTQRGVCHSRRERERCFSSREENVPEGRCRVNSRFLDTFHFVFVINKTLFGQPGLQSTHDWSNWSLGYTNQVCC